MLSYSPQPAQEHRSGCILSDWNFFVSIQKLNHLRFPQPDTAFANFQHGLHRALKLSKEELDQRVAEANAARTADRVQKGYAKRGSKPI